MNTKRLDVWQVFTGSKHHLLAHLNKLLSIQYGQTAVDYRVTADSVWFLCFKQQYGLLDYSSRQAEISQHSIHCFRIMYSRSWHYLYLPEREGTVSSLLTTDCPLRYLNRAIPVNEEWRSQVVAYHDNVKATRKLVKAGFVPGFDDRLFDEACLHMIREYADGSMSRPSAARLLAAGVITRLDVDKICDYYIASVGNRIEHVIGRRARQTYDSYGAIRFELSTPDGDTLYLATGDSEGICGLFTCTEALDLYLQEQSERYYA